MLRWKRSAVRQLFSKLPLTVNLFTRIILKGPKIADKYQLVHPAFDDAFSVALNCGLCL